MKAFKNQAKNTLSDKYAAMLLPYSQIGILNEQIVLQDLAGKRIVLKDLRERMGDRQLRRCPCCRERRMLAPCLGFYSTMNRTGGFICNP